MYRIILIAFIALLASCSSSNHKHNHHKNHAHKHPHNYDKLNHPKVLNHHHIDRGDFIQVVIKHKPRLSKNERKRIRRWCKNHYKHHYKPIKCKFVVVK